MNANTKFIYHNVGQGLFYSGNIMTSNSAFRFIYDCGSERIKLINTSICRFKCDINDDSEIDLLIISHLHSDHISGLDELFNNFTIKEVVLPYLSPTERLLIALRRINLPTWYYNFLSDPVEYLFKRGVKRIILLGGKEGGKGEIPPENLSPSSPEGDILEKLDIGKLSDDENLKKEIFNSNENWERYIKTNKLLVKNHNGYVIALGLWVFRFFNYKHKIPPIVFRNFERCIRNNVSKKNDNDINDNDIKRAIRDKKCLKSLKRCYTNLKKHLGNDFNNTSLVLYHGPKDRPKIESSFLCFCPHPYPCYFYSPRVCLNKIFFRGRNIHKYFGQLLTGDIDFNMNYNGLKKHYEYFREHVLIAQVPHHGSKNNWNSTVLRDFPNSKCWIISAGLENKYGHPSFEVVEDICSNGKKCCLVNEIIHMAIKGEVRW